MRSVLIFLSLFFLFPSSILADGYLNIPFRPINPEKEPDPWVGSTDYIRYKVDRLLPARQYGESIRTLALTESPLKGMSQEKYNAYFAPVSQEEMIRAVDRFFSSGKYNRRWWYNTKDKTSLTKDWRLGQKRMQRIDPFIVDMIKKNKDNYYIMSCGNELLLYVDSMWSITFSSSPSHPISVAKKHGPEDACWHYEKTPALDPWTEKPYFSLPRKTMDSLVEKDREYVQTVLDIVNENFHAYYGAPWPRLDMDKIRRGFLIGKFLNRKVIVTSQRQGKHAGVIFCRTDEEAKSLFDRFLEKETDLKRNLSCKLGRVCYNMADICNFSSRSLCDRTFPGSCSLSGDYRMRVMGENYLDTLAFTLPETDSSLNAMFLTWALGEKHTMIFCDWNALNVPLRGLKDLLQNAGVEPDAPVPDLSPRNRALLEIYRQLDARATFTQKAICTIFGEWSRDYTLRDTSKPYDYWLIYEESDRLFQKLFGCSRTELGAWVTEGSNRGEQHGGAMGKREMEILLRDRIPEISTIFPYENLAKMLDAVGMASPERFTYKPEERNKRKPDSSGGTISSGFTSDPPPQEKLEELEKRLKNQERFLDRDARRSIKDEMRELKKEIREAKKKK